MIILVSPLLILLKLFWSYVEIKCPGTPPPSLLMIENAFLIHSDSHTDIHKTRPIVLLGGLCAV